MNFLEISTEEKVLSLVPTTPADKSAKGQESLGGFLVMVTKDGTIKKTALEVYNEIFVIRDEEGLYTPTYIHATNDFHSKKIVR
jgi:hypothetical protein